ncbi:MAG: hypothetical protein KBA99_10790 [Bacteroidia bacterium]|jgi:hypothetical protein|nr:hypothetical protein [Bacteroidia bacterium]
MKESPRISNVVILSVLFILFACQIKAQDTLIYKNNDKRIVKLLELGIDEIKFRNLEDSSDVTRVIEKAEIKEIRLANHEIIRFNEDLMDARLSDDDQKKNQAIKLNFFAPLMNHLSFSYERMIKPWVNVEGELGVIGVGFANNEEDASGFLFRGGLKLIRRPDFQVRGQKLTHVLHGKYFKPEILYNRYSKRITYDPGFFSTAPSYTDKLDYSNLSIIMNFGKQYYVKGGFLIDLYFGLGYGAQFVNGKQVKDFNSSIYQSEEDYNDNFPYTHLQGNASFPISFTFGMRFGLAF